MIYEAIQKIVGATVPILQLEPNEVVFEEGEEGDELYIIHDGEVEIKQGKRVLATLGKDELFGEMALLENLPRSATAVCKKRCVLIPISQRGFLALVHHRPAFALAVMQMLSKRLRITNRSL